MVHSVYMLGFVLPHEQGHVQIFNEVCNAQDASYRIYWFPKTVENQEFYSNGFVTHGWLWGEATSMFFDDTLECQQAHVDWEEEDWPIKVWFGQKAYEVLK